MNNIYRILLIAGVCVAGLSAGWSETKKRRAPSAEATLAEVKQVMGAVPEFLAELPDDVVEPAWREFLDIGFADSAIPGKYKELMGLAVAAQIPCTYCTYAHTRFARLQGASDDEIKEAVLMAATVRRWSTYLNGLAVDEGAYRSELDRMLAHAAKVGPPPKLQKAPAIRTADEALRDVKQVFGFVPSFIKSYPRQGLASAWGQYKAIELDPAGALPPKYRELTGLAVAAQIPCRYCVIAHTRVARLFGASDAEIAETVALAGMTRQWSTVLNGLQIDERRHRRDVDAAIKHQRRRAASR